MGGSYYVDSGNCMIQVYFGSTQIMENGHNSRKYFEEIYKQKNNEDYHLFASIKSMKSIRWYRFLLCHHGGHSLGIHGPNQLNQPTN